MLKFTHAFLISVVYTAVRISALCIHCHMYVHHMTAPIPADGAFTLNKRSFVAIGYVAKRLSIAFAAWDPLTCV